MIHNERRKDILRVKNNFSIQSRKSVYGGVYPFLL